MFGSTISSIQTMEMIPRGNRHTGEMAAYVVDKIRGEGVLWQVYVWLLLMILTVNADKDRKIKNSIECGRKTKFF